jgi:pimeloyl-ACP methyl ester carboxylesterase
MTRRYQERAVLFGREGSLVGISCRPVQPEGQRPAILFINSGIVHRVGGNRIYVMLSRALADQGFSSLRFDLAGVGESPVLPNSPAMNPQERTEIDIDDALEFAAGHLDTDRFIMTGLCSGADNALRTMGRHESVVGTILLDLNAHRTPGYYLRHYSKSLRRGESWRNILTGKHPLSQAILQKVGVGESVGASEEPNESQSILPNAVLPLDMMRDHLERIVARDGNVLAIFTAGMEHKYNYETQFVDMFPGLDFGRWLRLEYFGDSDHSFSRQHHQERLKEVVLEWVETSEFVQPALPADARKPAMRD